MTTMVGGTAAIIGALALIAAQQPSALAPAHPGVWEINGVPGAKGPVQLCVADIAMLARFEHRAKACAATVIRDSGTTAKIDYRCGPSDFGQGEIEVLTPRSLRVKTQGISGGLPFAYLLQARRTGECAQPSTTPRH